MVEVSITDYLPDVNDLDPVALKRARDTIVGYLRGHPSFQDVDLGPSSVAGDLLVNPYAHLMVALDVGINRIFSDIDLANVSSGIIYNCDFVTEYLKNFGQGNTYEYPSTGVVRVTWASGTPKVLNPNTRFLFPGGADEYVFQADEITTLRTVRQHYGVAPTDDLPLVRDGYGHYSVLLAVKGKPGVVVAAGTAAKTNLAHTDLISVQAVGDFDKGTLPENLSVRANKVRKTYYASSLNSRNSAKSFLMQAFPEVRAVSPVVTGDQEMLRGSSNILGIKEGTMDLYFKSRSTYLQNFARVTLTNVPGTDTWRGPVTTDSVVTYIDGASRVIGGSPVVVSDVHARSTNPAIPGIKAAYSKFEQLGIQVSDAISGDSTKPVNKFEGDIEVHTDDYFSYQLSGVYSGTWFVPGDATKFKLDIVGAVDSNTVSARLSNVGTGESVAFNLVASGNVVTPTSGWDIFANGVSLLMRPLSGTASGLLGQLLGKSFDIELQGLTRDYLVGYRYDPNFAIVDTLVRNTDVQPVNMSVIPKNFVTCYVRSLDVHYRIQEGRSLDKDKAAAEVLGYVNSLAYPDVYDPYTLAEIVMYYGASGVDKVYQGGIFYQSVATKYGADLVQHNVTTDLVAPIGVPQVGPRNIGYILDKANLNWHERVV
jgi:hypothetical protein